MDFGIFQPATNRKRSIPAVTPIMDRKLNVLIEGECLIFSIPVELTGNVSDLKRAVHKDRADLQSVVRDHQKLAVSKVDIDLAPYATDVESLGLLDASGGQLLHPWETMSHHWPNQPPDSHLHVIVKLPAIRSSLKRSNPDNGQVERLKRSKLTTLAPSVLAQPSEYRSIQNRFSQRILDDRPRQDEDMSPVSLIYDGFGHFLDVFHGHLDVPGLSDICLTELQDRVDAFADSMCRFYHHEDDCRDAGTSRLNSIFAARTGVNTIPELWPGSIGSVATDGHNIGRHGAPGVVAKYKNWPAYNGCIPQVEIAGYVARSHARFVPAELVRRWRIPTLGLTIVGTEVRFYGVVLLGHQYRSVALTPALSCIASSTEGWERNALYNAFSAASVLLARIHHDAKRFITSLPPEIPDGTHHFPAVTKLHKWQGSGFLDFQINSFYGNRLPSRLLFTARTKCSESTILVKFARNYSIDAHQFCAALGRAPTILGFEDLPGGWCAIAMELFASAVPITQSAQVAVHRERWERELLELVQALHKEGFVHGDLRDANIICAEAIMMLIDFDWAGREGKAVYPHLRLNPALLDGRVSKDLKITKEDDMRVLMNMLKKLREITVS